MTASRFRRLRCLCDTPGQDAFSLRWSTLVTGILASLCHGAAHCLGDALAWRVGVKTAHELAFRVHQVKIGAVVHDVVLGARPALTRFVIDPILLGYGSDVLRGAGGSNDPRNKWLGGVPHSGRRVAPRIDCDEQRLELVGVGAELLERGGNLKERRRAAIGTRSEAEINQKPFPTVGLIRDRRAVRGGGVDGG